MTLGYDQKRTQAGRHIISRHFSEFDQGLILRGLERLNKVQGALGLHDRLIAEGWALHELGADPPPPAGVVVRLRLGAGAETLAKRRIGTWIVRRYVGRSNGGATTCWLCVCVACGHRQHASGNHLRNARSVQPAPKCKACGSSDGPRFVSKRGER